MVHEANRSTDRRRSMNFNQANTPLSIISAPSFNTVTGERNELVRYAEHGQQPSPGGGVQMRFTINTVNAAAVMYSENRFSSCYVSCIYIYICVYTYTITPWVIIRGINVPLIAFNYLQTVHFSYDLRAASFSHSR